jgi:hypothetical protein
LLSVTWLVACGETKKPEGNESGNTEEDAGGGEDGDKTDSGSNDHGHIGGILGGGHKMDGGPAEDGGTDAGAPEDDAGPDSGAGCVPADETCNGDDDDCDGKTDEDFRVGRACDGPDNDDCKQGMQVCNADGTGVDCDESDPVIRDEVCDNTDNDCDGEVDEGFDVGDPCDGDDSDLCDDGEKVCADEESTRCDDDATSLLDLCNNLDDDCDPASNDGAEDPRVGRPCDGNDDDVCTEGTQSCVSGGLSCSDMTGSSLDTNPVCSTAVTSLGGVSGDLGSDTLHAEGQDERFYRITIGEDDPDTVLYVSARIQLTPPVDADYDMFVYCASCGGAPILSSEAGTGVTDTVLLRVEDDAMASDTFDVIVEVRVYPSGTTVCDSWSLDVLGNVAVDPMGTYLDCHAP